MHVAIRHRRADFVDESSRAQNPSLALNVWHLISIVLLALVTGVFWGTWLGLSRSMTSLSAETFLTIGHTMIGNLGTVMAMLMPAALLSTLPVIWLLRRQHSSAVYPTLLGVGLFVVALLITLIVEVPINNRIAEWTVTTLPADWEALRERWEFFHAIRSWAAVTGLALLVGGALFAGDRGSATVHRVTTT